MSRKPTVIIGAGMAGLAAAIALSARGLPVILLERQAAVGGKMRQHHLDGHAIDAGPTVFTMKWVFDRLFAQASTSVNEEVSLSRAATLARHAWDASGHFDLFADQAETEAEVERFFGRRNAAGYARFCADSAAVFETLKDSFIAAPRPSPIGLANTIGWARPSKLLALKPFHTLWRALGTYFPDQRLQQLFGRYATYVGSSPYLAPATLMLIAHVERDGVWFVRGGMHALARAMADVAARSGADIRTNMGVSKLLTHGGRVTGVALETDEVIEAQQVLYCGDASRLTSDFTGKQPSNIVAPKDRSLSAITWSAVAKTSGFPLKRHTVFFSPDYRREFDALFQHRQVPADPTVYVCAQDRESETAHTDGARERLLCLINAPAFGDARRLSEQELAQCQHATLSRLSQCGLSVDMAGAAKQVTEPADFEALFPGSGGALYGRASHGWMASFARPGTRTNQPGLYLAGGSVHPGAGVPMATLSGMLAAQQIMADHAST